MLAWAGGDAAALGGAEGAVPTVADVLWLAFYPAAYLSVMLLVRSRLADGRRALWLDGLLAALAVAAAAVAVAWEPVSNAGELAGTLAVDLAYLVGDLLLLGVAAAALVLMSWRPSRPLAWVAAGLALSALADAFFLYEAAAGLELTTTAPATLWPLGALLIGLGAWQPAAAAPRLRAGRFASLVTPGAAGALALGVLVYGRVEPLGEGAAVLAVATLVLVLVRVTSGFAENLRLLREAERQAATDALTGLGNRRALMVDLDEALAEGELGEASALLLFDLDNFKHYNDAFGHPAGDALLARLGARLADALEGSARAYRLGGDEFCALRLRRRRGGDGRRRARHRGALRARPRASTSAPRTASCCCRRRPRSPPRRCRSPTAACTSTRASASARPSRARPATCCCRPCRSASPTCAGTSASSAASRRPPRPVWDSDARSASGSRSPPSCTTSARWPCRTRSSPSPARSTRASWASSASTRWSASGSCGPLRRSGASRRSCAPATSASTAPATPTGSPARRSRSAPGSWRSATRSTR